jgi:hypothetical protein
VRNFPPDVWERQAKKEDVRNDKLRIWKTEQLKILNSSLLLFTFPQRHGVGVGVAVGVGVGVGLTITTLVEVPPLSFSPLR